MGPFKFILAPLGPNGLLPHSVPTSIFMINTFIFSNFTCKASATHLKYNLHYRRSYLACYMYWKSFATISKWVSKRKGHTHHRHFLNSCNDHDWLPTSLCHSCIIITNYVWPSCPHSVSVLILKGPIPSLKIEIRPGTKD